MRELKKHNFLKVFDLQNSSRTNFYKNILFPKAGKEVWSSSLTTLPSDKNKEEFERGKDEGFEEAKKMGLIHANIQRETGQSQEFSRNRVKSGFAKLLLGNLNMDRFKDICEPGLSAECLSKCSAYICFCR